MSSLFGIKFGIIGSFIAVLFLVGIYSTAITALGKSEAFSLGSTLGNLGNDLANSIAGMVKQKTGEGCTGSGDTKLENYVTKLSTTSGSSSMMTSSSSGNGNGQTIVSSSNGEGKSMISAVQAMIYLAEDLEMILYMVVREMISYLVTAVMMC